MNKWGHSIRELRGSLTKARSRSKFFGVRERVTPVRVQQTRMPTVPGESSKGLICQMKSTSSQSDLALGASGRAKFMLD